MRKVDVGHAALGAGLDGDLGNRLGGVNLVHFDPHAVWLTRPSSELLTVLLATSLPFWLSTYVAASSICATDRS